MVERGVEVGDAYREMHVARVQRLVRPQRPAVALDEVKLSVPKREPGAGKVERRGTVNLTQAEYVRVEAPRSLQVGDGKRDVVKRDDWWCGHLRVSARP